MIFSGENWIIGINLLIAQIIDIASLSIQIIHGKWIEKVLFLNGFSTFQRFMKNYLIKRKWILLSIIKNLS